MIGRRLVTDSWRNGSGQAGLQRTVTLHIGCAGGGVEGLARQPSARDDDAERPMGCLGRGHGYTIFRRDSAINVNSDDSAS